MRVRVRRFSAVKLKRFKQLWNPERVEVRNRKRAWQSRLWASRQGPWGLPAVWAARSVPMIRWRSLANRTLPRFHCFRDHGSQPMPDPLIQISQDRGGVTAATLVKRWPAPHRRPPIRFCSSARAFDPRFFQTPPCDDALALLWLFTSPRLSRGLSPPSCQTCSAHQEKTGPELGPVQLTELCALEGELRY